MRCLHILISLRNRDVEIQIEGQDSTCDEHYEDGKGCVLEVCDLDFHGSKLDTPADVVSSWGRLETDVLPVCGLQVLEVVGFGEVQLFEIFGEDDDGVADEEMGEVRCQEGVHTAVHELLLDVWVDDEVWVEVLFS